jgi:hypothetical protein
VGVLVSELKPRTRREEATPVEEVSGATVG